MELIKFEDAVTITRDEGEVNEFDQLVRTEVWSGKGRYQEGTPVYSGILTTNSVLFLPSDVPVEDNDEATVMLHNGRVVRGVVSGVRNVRLPLTSELCTRMVLKQTTDKSKQSVEK